MLPLRTLKRLLRTQDGRCPQRFRVPEISGTPEIDAKDTQYFQELIGMAM